LNLTAVLGSGSGPSSLSGPHQNVATSLNNFFNGGGALPANFVSVFGLTGSALTTALSQLNGEVATGAERSSFQLTNEFLSLMLDPFVNGRGYVGHGLRRAALGDGELRIRRADEHVGRYGDLPTLPARSQGLRAARGL
jgi:hypothetical protein